MILTWAAVLDTRQPVLHEDRVQLENRDDSRRGDLDPHRRAAAMDGRGTAARRHRHQGVSFHAVTTLQTLRDRAAEILAIAASHGARNLRVVGSVARGTDGADSDVDLLVSFDPGVGLLEHARLVQELEALLGRKVDVASERGVRPQVRVRLEADALPL